MENKINQTWNLASIVGMTGLNGHAAIASLSGLFTFTNIPLIAVALMAGPGAIITSALLEGDAKERILVAVLAGVIATGVIVFSAAFGPKLFEFVNQDIIRIFGGIAIAFVALMIFGIKIPQITPLAVMALGIIASLIWRIK